jgi:undecaprenyl-diphosphatase
MVDALLWGLIQGLTEFLPISSSGHLVLVPAVLGRDGPDLATSAVLHLGTLAAVLVFFRAEVGHVVRRTPQGKRLLRLLIIGTIPAAALGFVFKDGFESLNDNPTGVAVALILTGIALFASRWIPRGDRTMSDSSDRDAVTLGLGQALALIPGVSRSGATIATGLVRGFDRAEAARFSFLLGIPAIAGAGLFEFIDLARDGGGVTSTTWVGMAVAAVSGYAAIALLLRLIGRAGLAPFGVYCVGFGTIALFLV